MQHWIDMFQSRNRGTFDFYKSFRWCYTIRMIKCFNLVIEVLLISTWMTFTMTHETPISFNLVIEVLLISTKNGCIFACMEFLFQSRNRGTFDFYIEMPDSIQLLVDSFNLVIEVLLISTLIFRTGRHWTQCFNLVIEVLLISTATRKELREYRYQLFQSRNRGTFDFYVLSSQICLSALSCFNLVIEVLLISTRLDVCWIGLGRIRFNLVIEVLLISTHLS